MARKVVGDVAVRVGADVGPLKIGLQDGARSVKRFERSGSASARKLARNVRNVALAATAMATALSAAGRRAISELDAIGKKSAQLGITAEALQEISFAAKSAGVSTSGLQSSMERFSKRLGEAEQGFGAAKKQLEFLNLEASELTKMPLDEALGVIADRMQAIESPTERAAVASGLFGREGVAMVNMLKEGGDALAETRREARDFGAVVSNETVAAAEDLEDELGQLADKIKAELNDAFVKLGPLIVGIGKGFAGAATAVGDLADALDDVITAAKDEGLRGVLDLMTGGGFKRAFPEPYLPNATEGDPNALSGLPGDELLPPRTGPLRITIGGDGDGWTYVDDDDDGGGGGGRSKTPVGPTQEDLERLKMAFATQREIITDAYQRDLDELEKFRNAGIAKEEELNALEKRIKEKHLQDLAELEANSRDTRLGQAAGFFGDLATATSQGGEQVLKVSRAFAAAEALISTYQGAAAELKKGVLGFGTAAAVIARGMAFVNAINSIGRGGTGGGGAGATSAAAAQPARTSQAAVIQLQGEIFGRDQVIKLINGINEAIEDGATVRLA